MTEDKVKVISSRNEGMSTIAIKKIYGTPNNLMKDFLDKWKKRLTQNDMVKIKISGEERVGMSCLAHKFK